MKTRIYSILSASILLLIAAAIPTLAQTRAGLLLRGVGRLEPRAAQTTTAAAGESKTTVENAAPDALGTLDSTDAAVYRDGNWFILNSSNNVFRALQFGLQSDAPVPAAYLP